MFSAKINSLHHGPGGEPDVGGAEGVARPQAEPPHAHRRLQEEPRASSASIKLLFVLVFVVLASAQCYRLNLVRSFHCNL